VLFYNTLANTRTQVVKVYVNTALVTVKDSKGATVLAQVEPYWGQADKIVTNRYKVCTLWYSFVDFKCSIYHHCHCCCRCHRLVNIIVIVVVVAIA